MPIKDLSLIPAQAHLIMAACSSHQEGRWRARLQYSRPSVSHKCSQIQRGICGNNSQRLCQTARRHWLPCVPHTL